jgi:hypothetical protein
MSDLTLPIIGLTTMLGYFFGREGRNARAPTVRREVVEAFEKPNGPNIYQSNKVDEVNKEMLEKSLQNYKLAEQPELTGVLPPLFNTYSVVGNEKIMSPSLNREAAQGSVQQMNQINKINKYTDVTKRNDIAIDVRPMFVSSAAFTGSEEAPKFTEFGSMGDAKVSLLTGLPVDENHNNMVPFFGSNVKQNIEKFTSDMVLDRHTGRTSEFKHKREIEKFFQETPENIYGNPVFGNEISTDRYIPSLFHQNEKLFDEQRINAPKSGTFENNIRPEFKGVDNLRTANKPKTTYKARTVAGQMGEVRGIQGEFFKRSPDTYYEKNMGHLFKTTGEFIAPKAQEEYATNFKDTSRQDYNLSYFGGPEAARQKDKQRYVRMDQSATGEDALVQNPKRQNFESDYLRNVGGTTSANDYGRAGITSYETERATTGIETHLSNVGRQLQGVKTMFQDKPKNTLKETTLSFDNSGNVKTKFDKGIINTFEEGISAFDAKTTHKQTTIINNYKGIMNKEDGMGYLVKKYDAKTTGKELISENSDYKGNMNYSSQTTSRQNYVNAEIRDTKEILHSGERPSGPQKFQISSGKISFGDVKLSDNMLLKEQVTDRPYKHQNRSQLFVSTGKGQIGHNSTWRKDNDIEDTVFSSRLQPEMVHKQHEQNPFSIYGSKQ